VTRLSGALLFALGYALLLEGMLVAAVLFWPEFAANLASLRSMTTAIPIAGEMLRQVEERGFAAYVLGQHFFKGCNALGTAAAVLFAAPAIAGEAHRGTLEMLLARPFSRTRLLLERYATGALALVLPIYLTTLTVPLLGERVEEYEPYAPYLLCATQQALFLLAIYGVTFLCSCLGSNPNKIALSVLFIAVSQFALYMVKTVTHWSLFRLCDMEVLLAIFDDGRWSAANLLALLGTIAVTLCGSWIAFQRRTP
jgi:ABC-type transport system involved in multi-copper enzyme maturation permease subunit